MNRLIKNIYLLVLAVAWAVCVGANSMGGQILLDFDEGFDFAAVETRDTKVSEAKRDDGSALRIEGGHEFRWPGITLKAPEGRWNLDAWEKMEMDIRNIGNNGVDVCLRVDNPGANGRTNCNTGRLHLAPHASGTLSMRFRRKSALPEGIELFAMRGYPFGGGGEPTIDTSNVTQLLVFVPEPDIDSVFEIDNIRATGKRATLPEVDADEFFPMIDEFGQYIHNDWPGKTHSREDLSRRLKEELAELKSKPGSEEWDRYGGWAAGPKLEATGFFRTQKYKGKWWLVDPEGRLFFSHGIDCVGHWDGTPVEEREHWFKKLPPQKGEFRQLYSRPGRVIRDYYKGKRPLCFNFGAVNLMRKYGDDWRKEFARRSHLRLRSWGLNTIGNWSDGYVYLMKKTPYVVAVHARGRAIEGSTGYWGKFRDVFDPRFAENLRKRMKREVGRTADDPWCIGYFVDNELAWGNETSLASAALISPPDQPAKKAFVADLKQKYRVVDKLNAAWGTKHASWDALLDHRVAPEGEKAREDMRAFYRRIAERYFKTCRDAVKEAAPNNLYLGCRFAWVNDVAAQVAARYCDVVGYNRYRRSVGDFRLPGGVDMPVIIGEFHFGALDRGMFHTGLVPVSSQSERAKAYKNYVRGALANPQIVGCHWFKYRDEATTGRPLDCENYQIGFVDIVDTPYPETIEACREVGYRLYQIRLDTQRK